jgi:hypothetical protein
METQNPSLLGPLVKLVSTNLNQVFNRVGLCPSISDLYMEVEQTSETSWLLSENIWMMHKVQQNNYTGCYFVSMFPVSFLAVRLKLRGNFISFIT